MEAGTRSERELPVLFDPLGTDAFVNPAAEVRDAGDDVGIALGQCVELLSQTTARFREFVREARAEVGEIGIELADLGARILQRLEHRHDLGQQKGERQTPTRVARKRFIGHVTRPDRGEHIGFQDR
jgi:hypothetical protein